VSPGMLLAPGEHAAAPRPVSSQNTRPSAAMPSRQSLKDEIISEHVHPIWFDLIPQCLVNWQPILIGYGTLL
jgi:hypothetical protein